MDIEFPSIYFDHLWFLSPEFYSFPHIYCYLFLLDLYQSILPFSVGYFKWNCDFNFKFNFLGIYRKAINFCICPSLLYSNYYLLVPWDFCWFFRIFYINKEQRQFYFFLSNFYAFISYFCLIAFTQTSSTVLNRSGEKGHAGLILHLRGKTCSFS